MTSRFAFVCAIAGATILCGASMASASDIIDEWASVQAPPVPALKPVTVDPKTTALLMLDFMNQNCGVRPRCVATVPQMKKLLAAARAKGAIVIYSFFGKTTAADVVKDLAPAADEPSVTSFADKFLNTDLDKKLKDKGIQTVIVTGTAANGAVLYTGSGAALPANSKPYTFPTRERGTRWSTRQPALSTFSSSPIWRRGRSWTIIR